MNFGEGVDARPQAGERIVATTIGLRRAQDRAAQIVVDGKVVPLGAGHVSGLSFNPPLPDGATQYLTAGAFIAPLARGAHTVEVRFKATGDALREPPIDQYFPDGLWEFSITYSVTVR